MNKKYIYTVGYTLFQQDNTINIEKLFDTLKMYNVDFLVDVRSVPFGKSSVSCPLKPSDSAPLKHSTMPP